MKKQGWILIAVTGAFFCLLLGIFLGRNIDRSYIQLGTNQTNSSQTSASQATTAQDSETLGKININTATAEQLQLLPGIGESLAQRILDYRSQNGPFNAIDDLMNVSGIGEKKFAGIKDYIIIG